MIGPRGNDGRDSTSRNQVISVISTMSTRSSSVLFPASPKGLPVRSHRLLRLHPHTSLIVRPDSEICMPRHRRRSLSVIPTCLTHHQHRFPIAPPPRLTPSYPLLRDVQPLPCLRAALQPAHLGISSHTAGAMTRDSSIGQK